MIFTRYIHVHFVIQKVDSIYVNRKREMVSFELGKEIEKDVFSSCHEHGTEKQF